MNMMSTLDQLQWSTGCVLLSMSGRSGTNSIHRMLTNTDRFRRQYTDLLDDADVIMNEPHSIQWDDQLDRVDIDRSCDCIHSDHSVWQQLDGLPVQGMFIKELRFWCGVDCRLFNYRGTGLVMQDRRSLHDHVFSAVIALAQQQWVNNQHSEPVVLTKHSVQQHTLSLAQRKLRFCEEIQSAQHSFYYEDHIDEINHNTAHTRNTHYHNSVINWDSAQTWYWQTVEQHRLREHMTNTGYATVDSLRQDQ